MRVIREIRSFDSCVIREIRGSTFAQSAESAAAA
jgi:hypothetical protein